MKKRFFREEKGLTMIELLATIAILVFAITIVLVLGNRAVLQSEVFLMYNKASFLAKEGAEMLKDENIITTIKEEASSSESYWEIDYRGEGEMTKKTSKENCGSLWINGGFYDHNSAGGGEETRFSRCIIAKEDGDALKIEIEVSFSYHGREEELSIYKIFYN